MRAARDGHQPRRRQQAADLVVVDVAVHRLDGRPERAQVGEHARR